MEQAQVLTFLNNKDRDLLLQFCGYSTTEPLHSFGPVVRPHYIIHFILNGKGIFLYAEDLFSRSRKWEYRCRKSFLRNPYNLLIFIPVLFIYLY